MIGRSPRVGTFALLLCLAAGCARPQYAERWPGRFLLAAGPQPGFAIKLVVERQPPTTLVGDDGSVCRTSRERFRGTREGRWVACDWNVPTFDSTQTAEPDGETGGQIAVLR